LGRAGYFGLAFVVNGNAPLEIIFGQLLQQLVLLGGGSAPAILPHPPHVDRVLFQPQIYLEGAAFGKPDGVDFKVDDALLCTKGQWDGAKNGGADVHGYSSY
jgi:hypothetical protein